MLAQLATLFRYRPLIQSLVARELKARYRGSVLGFVWSFVNPLLYSLAGTAAFNDVKQGPKTAVIRRNFVNAENNPCGDWTKSVHPLLHASMVSLYTSTMYGRSS